MKAKKSNERSTVGGLDVYQVAQGFLALLGTEPDRMLALPIIREQFRQLKPELRADLLKVLIEGHLEGRRLRELRKRGLGNIDYDNLPIKDPKEWLSLLQETSLKQLQLADSTQNFVSQILATVEQSLRILLKGKHVTQKIFSKHNGGGQIDVYHGVFKSIEIKGVPMEAGKAIKTGIIFTFHNEKTAHIEDLKKSLAGKGSNGSDCQEWQELIVKGKVMNNGDINYPTLHRSAEEALRDLRFFDERPQGIPDIDEVNNGTKTK